ncbi:hypothetical protein PHET_11969 [Paragonimus heterotremus]|uniref:Uncharacterized protein n=1 Tax=Paragonimus heterotremus TaxID=100268 RepID=A0A8J4WD85_9TREM|nr:hypothetical protein PHET_11969 [Paragonimus heterotremus]
MILFHTSISNRKMVDIQNYEFQIPTPASNPGPLAERAMYGFIVYIVSYVCFGKKVFLFL